MINGAPVIHVVDDDASFRTAIGRLLRASGYHVVLHPTATTLLETPPDDESGCILLDVQMPGVGGLALQGRLADLGCTLPIVFLTGHGDIPTSVRAIKAGAEDFLPKPVPKKMLLETLQRALARQQQTSAQRTRFAAIQARVAMLTPREHEVFAAVVRGKLNKQIAFQLGTAERTIKAHRHAVMAKLQVQSVAQLVSMASQVGVLATGRDAEGA
jgi:FixJ family two-component response regulator